jgi:glutamate carboxypeptidase
VAPPSRTHLELPALVPALEARLERMLGQVIDLIRLETPSADLKALDEGADLVAHIGEKELGVAPERVTVDGRHHLRWRLGSGPRRVLVLAHYDTVWPIGTLETIPCTIVDGVLRGPGSFDMKVGLVMALHALAELGAGDGDVDGVTLLITGDEEVGSGTSRDLIEQEAAGCRAALVLEASGPGGALKTERKGAGTYRVTVHGRAAHAGLEPERGVNAGVELARQVARIAAIGDAACGTSVTPTTIHAGTTANTVPERASVDVDVRVTSIAEERRVKEALFALAPSMDGARIEVSGGSHRPPLTRDASSALFSLAQDVARQAALPPLDECAVGGASDGNLTAGVGTPTLDGLGAVGGGAHASDEHVLVEHVVSRTALLTGIICRLLEEDDPVA